MRKTVDTIWEVWDHDVWGNAKDGYEVNDRSCICRDYPLRLKVQTANPGTPQEFKYAEPTDAQIRRALGIRWIRIETNGDSVYITVDRASDGYPIGEMLCVSHKSLSPIKKT